MTICGNVSSPTTLYPTQPIAIEQRLLEGNHHEIPLIMRENFAPFENHILDLAALLQKVITTMEYTNAEVQKVITELNKCIPMADVLTSLMETSLRDVIDILQLLENEEFTHAFITQHILQNEAVSNYLAGCDIQDNPYGPAKLLTELFYLEKHHECRAALVENFTETLNRRELQLLVSALLNTDSCVIPYLFPGLNNEQFEEFMTYAPRTLMDDLLKKSVPQDPAIMQWIVYNLNTESEENRLDLICEEATFDKISQDVEYVNNVFVPKYYTFKKLCEIFEANENDPDNILTHFQEDIAATPPFLFALGMHLPELRRHILLSVKLLSEEQLRAISISFSKDDVCEHLDEFIPCLLLDQVHFAFNSLTMALGAVYTLHKTEQLMPLYKEISDSYEVLEEKMLSTEIIISVEELSAVLMQIRRILSPVNLQLKKVILSYIPNIPLFFDEDPFFLKMIDRCLMYATSIEGMFQKCKANPLPLPIEKVILTKTIKALKLSSASELKLFGLMTTHDLEILGLSIKAKKIGKLKRYLQQEELALIWTYFRSKELYSLKILQDRCFIDDSEEAYNLKPLATKLGYVTSIEAEQKQGDE